MITGNDERFIKFISQMKTVEPNLDEDRFLAMVNAQMVAFNKTPEQVFEKWLNQYNIKKKE